MTKVTTILVLVLACLACGPPQPDVALVVRSVQDGVEVVENRADALEAAAAWCVEPVPELSIGVAQGAEELQLYLVGDAATIGERIVVVNAGTRELRWFDGQGGFLRATGGEGQGPGEFGFPRRLWAREDGSIAVWDPLQRRLSYFDAEGGFERSVAADEGGSSPDVVALFDDGGFALTTWSFSVPDEGFEDSVFELALFSPDGARVATLGSWPAGRMGRFTPLARVGRYLFDGRAHATGTSSAVWAGSGADPEVVRFAADGRREQIIRWPAANREVAPRHIDAYYRARLEDDPDDAELIDELRRVQPVAEHLPELGALVAAESGNLWVMRYQPPGDEDDHAWLVFDEGGALIARATTPAGFAPRATTPAAFLPFEIGDDYLLGSSIDEAGVEQVVRYRLQRGDDCG